MGTRILFIIFLSTPLQSLLYGQNINSYRLGVTAGLNAAQISTGTSHTDFIMRYNAGFTIEKRLTNTIALASEILYSPQGSQQSISYNTNGVLGMNKLIRSFDYLSLPIIFRYRPNGERLFIAAGGQIAYLLNAKNYFDSNKSQSQTYQHTNKIDAGLTGGLGYMISKHIIVDARYYYGMRPSIANFNAIDPNTGKTTYYQVEKWYNRVGSLNIFYHF